MAETIVLKSKGFDLKSRKDSMDARGSRPRGLCHGGEELVCSATPQARLGTGATWVAWQEVSVWDQTDLEGPGKAKAASSGSRESGAKAPVGTCYLLCLCRDPWELCSSVQGDGGRGGGHWERPVRTRPVSVQQKEYSAGVCSRHPATHVGDPFWSRGAVVIGEERSRTHSC